MRLHEEFRIGEPVDDVWRFFEQPERVAECMPGVEEVRVIDADNVDVRATQAIGPMSATFEASVEVLERVAGELIRFQATGKSVRGAAGHIRSTNEVRLSGVDGGTSVTIDGDVVLAGALGSVGQKIVAKQAGKVTAQFAENLQSALRGEPLPAAKPRPVRGPSEVRRVAPGDAGAPIDYWSRIAAVMSTIAAVLSFIAMMRTRRRAS
ncbi:MAG TPA: SRPBCC domain-containing protein [Mycobacteriales bacterium]|nr:SRPBCC domain-containing protein [Mycobacteriales bacterium]